MGITGPIAHLRIPTGRAYAGRGPIGGRSLFVLLRKIKVERMADSLHLLIRTFAGVVFVFVVSIELQIFTDKE